MVVNRGHYQKTMESGTQFMWNLIDSLKTVQLPNPLLSFFKTFLAATKKQKLFNKGNSVLFIDSTSIEVSPDANMSRNTQ